MIQFQEVMRVQGKELVRIWVLEVMKIQGEEVVKAQKQGKSTGIRGDEYTSTRSESTVVNDKGIGKYTHAGGETMCVGDEYTGNPGKGDVGGNRAEVEVVRQE